MTISRAVLILEGFSVLDTIVDETNLAEGRSLPLLAFLGTIKPEKKLDFSNINDLD